MKTHSAIALTAIGIVIITSGLISPAEASNSGTGLPWEEPLERVKDSITGPVANAIAVAAIAITGLALALGEAAGIVKRGLQIIFGLAVAFGAFNIVSELFDFGGGALI